MTAALLDEATEAWTRWERFSGQRERVVAMHEALRPLAEHAGVPLVPGLIGRVQSARRDGLYVREALAAAAGVVHREVVAA